MWAFARCGAGGCNACRHRGCTEGFPSRAPLPWGRAGLPGHTGSTGSISAMQQAPASSPAVGSRASPSAQPPAPVPDPGWRSSAWHSQTRSLPAASACAHSSASSAPGSPQARAAPRPPTQRLPHPPACQALRCSAHICGITWVQPSWRAVRRLRPRGSRRGERLLVQWAPAFSIHVLMNHLTKMQPNSRRICSEQCGFVEGTAALCFPRQDPSSAAKLLCASQEPER